MTKYADKTYANFIILHTACKKYKLIRKFRVAGKTKYVNIQIILQLRPKKYHRY